MNHREQRSLNLEKRKMRDAIMAKRMALPHAAMLSASQSVARHFADHPILAFAPSFAAYCAMRGELDVMSIFQHMARFNKTTALPWVTPEKSLLFREWKIGDPLERHTLGMEEPLASAPEITPAVVLVPLVAFDGEGYRLGYGGGFYDRTISQFREIKQPPLFIGVAYSMQEVDQVPTDEHDHPLDGILTELGVSMF